MNAARTHTHKHKHCASTIHILFFLAFPISLSFSANVKKPSSFIMLYNDHINQISHKREYKFRHRFVPSVLSSLVILIHPYIIFQTLVRFFFVDGTLLLEELTAHFPGTTTLKYRSKEATSFRSVKCSVSAFHCPGKRFYKFFVSYLLYCHYFLSLKNVILFKK